MWRGGTGRAILAGGRTRVRIVVAGDCGTGRSSLIATAAAMNPNVNVPPLLPPMILLQESFQPKAPLTLVDTSSRTVDFCKVAAELKQADSVVLTYACYQPHTFDRLSTFWLPKLRLLEVKVPVIVVGCKQDLRDKNQQFNLEQVMSPLKQQFPEIENYMIFDPESQELNPRFVRALKRIFILFDHDKDGALSDAELNDYQVKWSNGSLSRDQIVAPKKAVQYHFPSGVNKRGFTPTGFLFLHKQLIKLRHLQATWIVLRRFGYNNDIELADELIPSPLKQTPDQDKALQPHELEELFSTAPESSDESSRRRATELLVEVSSHGEDTGFEVPCLVVAAKSDLVSFPLAIQHSTRVCVLF
ncbi:Mitochondrial Rho GTPase 1 [Morus notabilis]|uniref:Mitochondrial Rho GTPase 1 n=1 Tax=Morus notabilis TaxID=981085 RepID=W9RVS0_9ROSA|nr:Mitochondrial Rho GTPase 1 [Morus notabilis]